MLNQLEPVAGELEARRAVAQGLRVNSFEVPPSPIEWAEFDAVAVLGGPELARDPALAALGQRLCEAPARTSELRALWQECLVTAAFAVRLAPRLGGDARTSAIAALLHRLGDMLALHAIGAAEQAARVHLDGPSKHEMCALHGGALLERALRAWRVPARAATTAAEWRRLHEFPTAAADAATVYLARLMSLELISPQYCVPGVVEHAATEIGLDVRVADEVRQDAAWSSLLRSLDTTIRSAAPHGRPQT